MAKLNVLSRKIIIEQMEKITSELLEFMMNSNIEMKLGQLLDICFQILKMMTKSLLKMEEALIANVCKWIVTKIEDFDEAILVVQICVGKFGIRDVLLDGGSSVNVIFLSLKKKLGLKKPKLVPFVVMMAD